MRHKKDGTTWNWGTKTCKSCGIEFNKKAPRNDYCMECQNLRKRERVKESQEFSGVESLTDEEVWKRIFAARETKKEGFEVLDTIDVLDGLRKASELGIEFEEFYDELSKEMTTVTLPEIAVRKQKKRKTLSMSKRQAPLIGVNDVLVVLIYSDLEREVSRKVGEFVVDYQITEEDKQRKVVFLDVDHITWTTEPLRRRLK